MAGIPEKAAEAAARQGAGLAKHLGVPLDSPRGQRIYWGVKRSKGWIPSTQVHSKMSVKEARRRQ